jgi:hypothetical protein
MLVRALALTALLSAGLASAGEVQLPSDLQWCADRGDVTTALPDATELSDGVIEGEGTAFGLRGTMTALLEEDQLLGVRFRCFDTDKSLAAVRSALTGLHGEGTVEDRTREGGDRRLKIEWEVDAQQSVSLKVNSEQIYVAWEAVPARCIEAQKARTGLTDAEKADIEATTKKKAIAFDPFDEKIEDVDARKKAKEDAEKKEKEDAEEEAPKEEPKDVDIDW